MQSPDELLGREAAQLAAALGPQYELVRLVGRVRVIALEVAALRSRVPHSDDKAAAISGQIRSLRHEIDARRAGLDGVTALLSAERV